MPTKTINVIIMSLFFGITGAFLYDHTFSQRVVFMDLDTVINGTKDRIIETYGDDPEAVREMSKLVGQRIQEELESLSKKHVVIAENAVLAGGKNYTSYLEEQIAKAMKSSSK